jgi:hypothetical protein
MLQRLISVGLEILKLCSVALWTKNKRRRSSATASRCWTGTENEDGCCVCVGSWDFGVVVLVVPRRSIYNGRWRARRACDLLRKRKCLPI